MASPACPSFAPPRPKGKNCSVPGAVKYFNETVAYTCWEGYTLNGPHGTLDTDVLTCTYMGVMDKDPPASHPFVCAVQHYGNASKRGSEDWNVTDYAQRPVEYQCIPGYSQLVDDNPRQRRQDYINFETIARPTGTCRRRCPASTH